MVSSGTSNILTIVKCLVKYTLPLRIAATPRWLWLGNILPFTAWRQRNYTIIDEIYQIELYTLMLQIMLHHYITVCLCVHIVVYVAVKVEVGGLHIIKFYFALIFNGNVTLKNFHDFAKSGIQICDLATYINKQTRTTRTPAFWGYPHHLIITHPIKSYWIPRQKKTKSKLQI